MDNEALKDILGLIERYGLSLVILILVVAYFVPKMNIIWTEYSLSRNKRELTEKQMKALNVDTILRFDLKVKALLQELLSEIDCDWCQLWQFHNGIYSLGLPHIPFLYVSITHEVTSDSVTPMSLLFRSLPTNFFRDAGEKWETEDVVITNLAEGASHISKTYALGAMANCLLPIRNSEGKLTAILSIGYVEIHQFAQQELVEMKNTARRLGIFLATALIEATSPNGLDGEEAKKKTPPFGIKPIFRKGTRSK